jgi:hypothetical protein
VNFAKKEREIRHEDLNKNYADCSSGFNLAGNANSE